MARVYRRHPDSSDLAAPRVFARVFCRPGEIAATVDFYRTLTSAKIDLDQDFPENGLRVVGVGAFLILERAPADDLAAQTSVTVLCAHVDATAARQIAGGAEVVQERWTSSVGAGIRLRHPDGLLVEYLEHRPLRQRCRYPREGP